MQYKFKKFIKWFLSEDLNKYKDDINRKNFMALYRFVNHGNDAYMVVTIVHN